MTLNPTSASAPATDQSPPDSWPADPSSLFAAFSDLEHAVPGHTVALDDIMALLWVQENPSSTAGALARAFHLSKPKASRTFARLRHLGLLREGTDPTDLRACTYRLSNRGENVVFELGRLIGKDALALTAAGYRELRHALTRARGAAPRRLPDVDLCALLVLSRRSPLAIGRLAAALHVSQPRASMSVARLHAAGLVDAVVCPTDARKRETRLTPAGAEVAECLQFHKN